MSINLPRLDESPQTSVDARGCLHGIRVLDFTAVMAGPHCTRLMADLGAEVIKIESPDGDLIRRRPPLRDGRSTYFAQLNCGKRSIALDLKSKTALDVVRRLADISDVVVENFRPGVMDRLGLDYGELSRRNPRLVYCSISGYGQTGPGAKRAAYAPIIHASSGYDAANLSYQPVQDQPASTGIFVADVLGGAYAFGAIQAALVHRIRFDRGQHIDLSLMDSMLNLMVFECQEAQFPSDRRRPVYTPTRTREGHVIIAPISQKNFESMADAMGEGELKADPRFSAGGVREQHWAELTELVERWTEQRTGAECEAVMNAAGVPCARFISINDALQDPQLAARGSLARIRDDGGEFIVPNAPFRMSGTPTRAGPNVSDLGADSEEVLSRLLDLSEREIAALRAHSVSM
jgi:crotonobetainyl-CoA:carnitine CoA-transferase CaiB-like acyl-CoA transferase